MKKLIIILIVIFILGAGFLFLLSSKNTSPVSEKRQIICFGDSITEGHHLSRKLSYPHQLGLLLGEPVINEGISGETSSHALRRIQKDVLDKSPRIVIVQFGGNDPHNNIPVNVTLTNNDLMIEQIINAGSEAVILIGESNMLEPKYLNGFRVIAKKRNVLLIEDAIAEIIKDPTLSSDGVHPTAQGVKIMTQRIYELLRDILK